jgi:TPR repeat protein
MLKDLYLKYLDTSVARRLHPLAFSAGVTWATQPIQATSALLTQQDHGYVAFDYLVDRVQADPSTAPVLDVVWQRLLHDVSRDDASAVGLAAFRADRREIAEQAWRKAAEAGYHDAEYLLGALLAPQKRTDEAEQWLRPAAEAGNHAAQTLLGTLLRDRNPDQAEHWYRRAAEAGNHDAEYNLGQLLQRRGDLDQAGQWYRKAAAAGPEAAEIAMRAQQALRDLQQ